MLFTNVSASATRWRSSAAGHLGCAERECEFLMLGDGPVQVSGGHGVEAEVQHQRQGGGLVEGDGPSSRLDPVDGALIPAEPVPVHGLGEILLAPAAGFSPPAGFLPEATAQRSCLMLCHLVG